MGRFFNKYELVNIMLIILLLGMNSFTEMSISYISYENKRNHIGLIMTMAFVLLDVYIYCSLVSSRPLPDVVYTAAEKIALDCEHENDKHVQDIIEQLKSLKNICNKPVADEGSIISKKIVISFVLIVIFIVIVTSIMLGGYDPNSNSIKTRILLSTPLLALAGGVIGIAKAI